MSGLDHDCIIDLLDSDDDDNLEDDDGRTSTNRSATISTTIPPAKRRSKRLRKCTTNTTTTTAAAARTSLGDCVSIDSSDDDDDNNNDSEDEMSSSSTSSNDQIETTPHKFNQQMSLMERLRQRKTGIPSLGNNSDGDDDDDDDVNETMKETADDDDYEDIVATVSVSDNTMDIDTEDSIMNNNNNKKKKNTKHTRRQTNTNTHTTNQENSTSIATINTTKNITTNAADKLKTKKKLATETTAYLKKLRTSVTKRTFPLHQIPTSEIISTGRTIKKMTAWAGHWPPLREFLQNTIDHLNLLDGTTGRRRACIDLTVTTNKDDDDDNEDEAIATTIFKFSCGQQTICAIHVTPDELIIDQSYTHPISSRALDTGVPDTTKDRHNPNYTNQDGGQAGGFGDGFKTAAVALIANSVVSPAVAKRRKGWKKGCSMSDFTALKWYFYARKERTEIEWNFEGLTRESVATFAKCDVLQVKIQKRVNVDTEQWRKDDSDDDDDSGGGAKEAEGQQYLMRQVIQVKGIGTSFINLAIPRFVVFWDLHEPSLLSTIIPRVNNRGGGGDFIGLVSSQPPLVVSGSSSNTSSSSSSPPLRPCCGVYVQGIYVRPTKIKGTIMCFFGNRLEVTGRDRNEVEQESLVEAVVYVLKRCSDMDYLRRLLEPLRGRLVVVDCNDDSDHDSDDGGILSSCTSVGGAKGKASKRRRACGAGWRRTKINSKTTGNKSSSWLLQTPSFFNRVIELEKDFILYNVFQIPKGAIFVSSKTTGSKDPFIKWAANFLQKNGAPLVPIEKGANRYLFEEVSESELTDRCIDILKRGGGSKTSDYCGIARKFFSKIFISMGIGRTKIHFFADVKIAFVHYAEFFIPEVTHLTRDLIVRVLNICNSHIEDVDGERYSCLMQAVFEILPPTVASTTAIAPNTIEVADAVKVVKRANTIQKEINAFLSNPMGGDDGSNAPVAEEPARKKRSNISSSITQDLTMLDDSDDDDGNVNKSTSTPSEHIMPPSSSNICDNQQLEQQIQRISHIAKGGANNNDENNIIPQAEFGNDDAGNHDSCLRASSSLEKIAVDVSFGGGYLHCDHTTAVAISRCIWDRDKRRRLSILRNILQEASTIVCRSIPSLHTLLERIHSGYDGDNDTYEAFCDGQRIIVNLFAYMPKLTGDVASINPPYSRSLVHDFVVMITHEVAHFLEPRGGHGPEWRDTHMKMLIKVMNQLDK